MARKAVAGRSPQHQSEDAAGRGIRLRRRDREGGRRLPGPGRGVAVGRRVPRVLPAPRRARAERQHADARLLRQGPASRRDEAAGPRDAAGRRPGPGDARRSARGARRSAGPSSTRRSPPTSRSARSTTARNSSSRCLPISMAGSSKRSDSTGQLPLGWATSRTRPASTPGSSASCGGSRSTTPSPANAATFCRRPRTPGRSCSTSSFAKGAHAPGSAQGGRESRRSGDAAGR